MRRLAAVCVLVGALVVPAGTQADDSTPYSCDAKPSSFHAKRARGIARASFALKKWRDGTPVKPAQRRWFRWQVECIYSPPGDAKLRAYRKARKRDFYRYRNTGGPLTPYGKWAIPGYIVACESGGSWNAYNPSGAVGPYQLLGWGAPFPVDSWKEKMAHHRLALYVMRVQGPGAWVCA